jgi:hypothetical protein
MVVRVVDYQLIAGHLYNMGIDNILRICVLEHERPRILAEAQKVFHGGLWWVTIQRDAKD